jgi:hypothetical protein
VIRIDLDTGGPTGHVDVPSPCGHAGGLAVGGDGILYVADTQTLFATPLVRAFDGGAQGAAIGAGGLWIARSDWNWGTLDRLDPLTGAPQCHYEIAPGTEGIAFGNTGRLWAVSEAGSRHIYDHPSSVCSNRFSRWSSRSTSLAWSESDYVPPT